MLKKIFALITIMAFNMGFSADQADKNISTFSDKVFKIEKKSKLWEISFKRHAAIYFLLKSGPNFEKVSKVLESNANNDKVLKITYTFLTNEIKEISE